MTSQGSPRRRRVVGTLFLVSGLNLCVLAILFAHREGEFASSVIDLVIGCVCLYVGMEVARNRRTHQRH